MLMLVMQGNLFNIFLAAYVPTDVRRLAGARAYRRALPLRPNHKKTFTYDSFITLIILT